MVAQAADYNGQIARGEDVISRIIYAKRDGRLAEMQEMVVSTINRLLEAACKQVGASTAEIFKLAVAGNTTMMHLLLAIPPDSIRLEPYIPVVNHVPTLTAGERLAVIEAMKMENILTATQDGTVAEVLAAKGESLAVDQPILKFA